MIVRSINHALSHYPPEYRREALIRWVIFMLLCIIAAVATVNAVYLTYLRLSAQCHSSLSVEVGQR